MSSAYKDLEAPLLFITHRCGVPTNALTKLKTKRMMKRFAPQMLKLSNKKKSRSKAHRIGRPIHTAVLGHSRLRKRPAKMPFTRAAISSLETFHLTTRVGSDCP
jgi:hypothetical protein